MVKSTHKHTHYFKRGKRQKECEREGREEGGGERVQAGRERERENRRMILREI